MADHKNEFDIDDFDGLNDDIDQSFNDILISADDSKVQVWVVPTNEELMIAKDTAELVNAAK